MRRLWPPVVLMCVIAIVLAGRSASVHAQLSSLIHDSGQSVIPVYEGYYTNPDGTTVVSFGFFNRNAKEEVVIPTGPNNKFDPAPADRGQPTSFVPRRQSGAFTVTLPKGAEKTLTWTLISRGETFAIPANFDQLYIITPFKDPTNGNTPPVVKFDPAGQSGQGPAGLTISRKATVATPLTLDAWVTDDGVFQVTRVSPVASDKLVNVTWSKYRGPGTVAFGSTTPEVDKTSKTTTTATFSAPGEYVLRLLAADTGGSGSQCCWTNGFVNVSVSP
jgi:hypothetical protein